MGPGIELDHWAASSSCCLIAAVCLAGFLPIPPRALWDLSLSWHVLGATTCQEPFPTGSVGKTLLLFPSTLYGHTALFQQAL